MKNANSIKKTATIPGDLIDRFNKYNQDHPESPLKISAILQAAIKQTLEEKGY